MLYVDDSLAINCFACRMSRLKKKAQEEGVRQRGRGKTKKVQDHCTIFKLSITILVDGGDIDQQLLKNVNQFLVEWMLAGKCSLDRGGATYHLHFQMVVRIEARNLPIVSKLLKEYLGGDLAKPTSRVVICKKLRNRGLHTFHGMLWYCMKDVMKDHTLRQQTTISWQRI